MTHQKRSRQELLLGQLQGDLPVERRPFGAVASRAGLTEEAVLETIRDRMSRGIIRRFGAILRHQKAGVTQNAMVVWAVPLERAEEVGTLFSSFREITHCYERCPAFQGRYNLFTMVHTVEGGLRGVLTELTRRSGIDDCQVLLSEEEFKKSSMEYFSEHS
jgi:DNA-binding Lrp family transcriptional regulator